MNELSDRELYAKARKYGGLTLFWRRKFIGLLPEVHKRRLWEKRGYSSVFVFAFKMAGLSERQVRRVLNLEKRFSGALHEALISGEVSVNKLARVASIVNDENEADLAARVRVLPQSAVETLVRDLKFASENGLFQGENEGKSVRAHIQLSDEVQAKLSDLAAKGFDINELLLGLLHQREENLETEKEEVAAHLEPSRSRYIPVRVRRLVKKEHGSKCSVRACLRDSEHLHHSVPFSMNPVHDPRYLAPLCKDHHDIAHSVNLNVQSNKY
jgi:hypothetical protein